MRSEGMTSLLKLRTDRNQSAAFEMGYGYLMTVRPQWPSEKMCAGKPTASEHEECVGSGGWGGNAWRSAARTDTKANDGGGWNNSSWRSEIKTGNYSWIPGGKLKMGEVKMEVWSNFPGCRPRSQMERPKIALL